MAGISKRAAEKLARKNIGRVHVVAAGRGGNSWGFNSWSERYSAWTTSYPTGFFHARAQRAEAFREEVESLMLAGSAAP